VDFNISVFKLTLLTVIVTVKKDRYFSSLDKRLDNLSVFLGILVLLLTY